MTSITRPLSVVFRVDANAHLGMGHLARCSVLASEIISCGGQTHFILAETDSVVIDWLTSGRLSFSSLQIIPAHWSWQVDLDAAKQHIEALNFVPDWVVVDHYQLDENWEQGITALCRKVMVIDDLANRKHACHILLDQNSYEDPVARYEGFIDINCRCLFGPQFALLRSEFNHEMDSGNSSAQQTEQAAILICFGGGDQSEILLNVLEVLTHRPERHLDLWVAYTSQYSNEDKLLDLKKAYPQITVFKDTSNIAHLMALACFSIGSGGSMTWERAAMGLPSLIYSVAANQEPIAFYTEKSGIAYYLGRSTEFDPAKLSYAVNEFLSKPDIMKTMAIKGQKLVDGKGVSRVIGAMHAI